MIQSEWLCLLYNQDKLGWADVQIIPKFGVLKQQKFISHA